MKATRANGCSAKAISLSTNLAGSQRKLRSAWTIFGLRRLPESKRRHTLERYIRDVLEPTVPVLPYDARAAEWHAVERARLGAVGRTPSYVDGSIAAVSHTNQLILVTHNLSNYEDFEGLELEDWSRNSLGIKSGDEGS